MAEDSQWMLQLAQGHTEAFNLLYQKYAGAIFGFFKSRVKDMDLVYDLNQMTWEKVYKKAPLFDTTQNFSSWLYTMASHIMIDEIRKKTRLDRFKKDYLDEYDNLKNDENYGNEIPSEDKTLLANEMLDLRLNVLSDVHRQALELRYLEEKTFTEIAEHLNLSEVNVRQIISRSLKKLRGKLNG